MRITRHFVVPALLATCLATSGCPKPGTPPLPPTQGPGPAASAPRAPKVLIAEVRALLSKDPAETEEALTLLELADLDAQDAGAPLDTELQLWMTALRSLSMSDESERAASLAKLKPFELRLAFGDLALKSYDSSIAKRCFRDALKLKPKHADALTGIARALAADFSQSPDSETLATVLAAYRRAQAAAGPKQGGPWALEAAFLGGRIADLNKLLKAQGKDRRALQLAALEQALKREPTHLDALRLKANLLGGPGARNPKEALAALNGILAQTPEDLNALRARVLTRILLLDLEGALADADLRLKLDAKNPEAWRNRARLKGSLGDLRGALADSKHALSLCQSAQASGQLSLADYYVVHATRLQALGRWEEAEDSYAKALATKKRQDYVYLRRARAHLRRGALAKAASDYSAVGPKPHGSAALADRGLIYLLSGDRQRAKSDFSAALLAWKKTGAHPTLIRETTLFVGMLGDKKALEGLAPRADHQGLIAQVLLGQLDPKTAVDRAGAYSGQNNPKGARLGRVIVLSYLGVWAWLSKDDAKAEASFAACLKLCRAQPAASIYGDATFWQMRDVALGWRSLHPK